MIGDDGSDLDDADSLVGGAGQDNIIAGAGDVVEGMAGGDQTIVSHWNSGGNAALWRDFAIGEDQVAFFDGSGSFDPARLGVTQDSTDPSVGHVTLDGETILTLYGGGMLSAGDITVIDQLPS